MDHLLSTVIFLPFLGGLSLFLIPFEKVIGKEKSEEGVR
jgi:hypothetical protein